MWAASVGFRPAVTCEDTQTAFINKRSVLQKIVLLFVPGGMIEAADKIVIRKTSLDLKIKVYQTTLTAASISIVVSLLAAVAYVPRAPLGTKITVGLGVATMILIGLGFGRARVGKSYREAVWELLA